MTTLINDKPDYAKCPVKEFQGNPLVEALVPPPLDDTEAILRLRHFPEFDESERALPPIWRMFMPARLRHFMFPQDQQVMMFKAVYRQILDGYRSRNPIESRGQLQLYGQSADDPATITFLTGLSGSGKSTLIRSIMSTLGKPVIKHSNYGGEPFTDTQIIYLMRNLPDQCDPRNICRTFGHQADRLIKNDFYANMFINDTTSASDYVNSLESLIRNNHVGAIVMDDFQNVDLTTKVKRKQIFALITNMREQLPVPIFLVGTYKALNVLISMKALSLSRRVVEGDYLELKVPKSCEEKDWHDLCEICWMYQWVKNPKPLTDDIVDYLYDGSQGITGIMLTLYILAQVEAIESGREVVDLKMLKNVYETRLSPLHPIIDALRSRDPKILGVFDDLYIKAMKIVTQDPDVSKIAAIEKEFKDAQKEKLGCLSDTEEITAGLAIKTKRKRIKRTTTELNEMLNRE